MMKLYTYSNIENQEGILTANIEINHKHELFKGHFPNKPVLPGVIEIQMIKNLLSQSLGVKFKLSEVKNAKYTSLILPEKAGLLNIIIEYQNILQELKTKVVIKDEENIYLKFSGTFTENE